MDRYRTNENAPQVRFIRRNGRVIPLISGNRAGVKPRVATDIMRDQLEAMEHSIDQAERGKRVMTGYGTDFEVKGFKSSFPFWYSEIGFKNQKDFYKTLKTPGAKQFRLTDQAERDIVKGESYGFGLPNRSTRYKLATRKIFDNEGVVFRKIGGKVRPLRVGEVKKHTAHDSTLDWFKEGF
jgi:hypothetical protein